MPRMPRGLGGSALMKPFVVLALPGMYLFYKYSQYKRQQLEQNRRKVTERELAHLNNKIDKLLTTLDENEPEIAAVQEDECVICVNAKASMETWPCGHRVVCRKCFVKTIQVAVSQRLLPLRCVICRAKILRLKQTLANSASEYSITQVHNSESLYSMASASSSISGCSSTSMSSTGSGVSSKLGNTRTLRQPLGPVLRKTQTQSMKYHLQEYKEPVNSMRREDKQQRLTPIQEFQREFRLGKERSSSTRIRCAQKIVTQLESSGPSASGSGQQPPSSNNTSRRSSHGFSFGKTNCSQLQKKAQKEEQKRQKNLIKKIARLEAEEAKEAAAAAAASTTSNPSTSTSSDQPSTTQDKSEKSNKKDKKEKEKKEKEKKEKDKKEKEKKDAEKNKENKENKKESKSDKKSNKKESKQ